LSFLSLKSSNSYSFQPINALSISTSWIGDASKPLLKAHQNLLLYTIAALYPNVKEGRITKGKPNSCAISLPLR
jgi:hypothetical protein